MKTLKILSAIGLTNLAVVAGIVFVLNSRTVPIAFLGPPPIDGPTGIPAVRGVLATPISRNPAVTPTPNPLPITSPAAPPTGGQTQPSTPPPANSVPPPQSVATGTLSVPPDNRCIVTIQGKRYDVAPLRSPHTGGDIFICGTDMTDVFFSQHNQRMLDGKMQQFLLP